MEDFFKTCSHQISDQKNSNYPEKKFNDHDHILKFIRFKKGKGQVSQNKECDDSTDNIADLYRRLIHNKVI